MWMAGKDVKLGEINTSPPEKTAKDSEVPSNPTITKNDSNKKENDSRDKNFTNIKMPTKMLKRSRPKGSEQTVIGLPKNKAKKSKIIIKPFWKLTSIPDMVKDENNVDIHRVEKYFTNEAWEHILDLIAKSKKQGKWICPGCRRAIQREDSISCDQCLNWYHLHCTSLNNMPKKQNWFCRPCISKYT